MFIFLALGYSHKLKTTHERVTMKHFIFQKLLIKKTNSFELKNEEKEIIQMLRKIPDNEIKQNIIKFIKAITQ